MRVEFYNDENGQLHHLHLIAENDEEFAMLERLDGQFVVCRDLANRLIELAPVVLAHTFTQASGRGTIQ